VKNRALFLLTTLAALTACRNGTSPNASGAAPESVPHTTISLPAFTDPSDPRREWILDLLRPRLSRLSTLKWQCLRPPTGSDGTLEISLEELKLSCEDFLTANFPKGRKPTPSCPRPGWVRIPLKDEACSREGKPPTLFAELRLPEGHGLYQRESAELLRPRNDTLPLIEWHESVPARNGTEPRPLPPTSRGLASPKMTAWLPQSSFRGAVSLRLEPLPRNAREAPRWQPLYAAAKARLERMVPPKLFRPTPELLMGGRVRPSAPTAAGATEATTPPIVVHNNYRDPLYRESCDYVASWIATRQLLDVTDDEEPPAREEKPIEFECRFRWVEDAAVEGSIALASLPLPLVVESGTDFPFKTLDDALSSSQFQSLKIP
jgi:hypothetical protein